MALNPKRESKVVDLGVSPAIAERFSLVGDGTESARYSGRPTVVAVVRAEKADRVLRLSVAVATGSNGDADIDSAPVAVNVMESALASMPLHVRAENAFLSPTRAGIEFEPYARADADGDGIITPAELEAVEVPCGTECGEEFGHQRPGWTPRLLDVLTDRLGAVLQL